jgi:hypothetical protein
MADDSTPTPDPTVLTTEALIRAVNAERDYVDGRVAVLEQRLHAIDVATRLLNETVNRVPTDVQREVSHLTGLMDERLRSIGLQFAERDTRQEREARDNKLAVDAAFAAQEKQAAAQNKANAEAIGKSEIATSETIRNLTALLNTTGAGLGDKIDDLKERVGKVESIRQGGRETISGVYALAGFLASVVLVVGFLVASGAFKG